MTLPRPAAARPEAALQHGWGLPGSCLALRG